MMELGSAWFCPVKPESTAAESRFLRGVQFLRQICRRISGFTSHLSPHFWGVRWLRGKSWWGSGSRRRRVRGSRLRVAIAGLGFLFHNFHNFRVLMFYGFFGPRPLFASGNNYLASPDWFHHPYPTLQKGWDGGELCNLTCFHSNPRSCDMYAAGLRVSHSNRSSTFSHVSNLGNSRFTRVTRGYHKFGKVPSPTRHLNKTWCMWQFLGMSLKRRWSMRTGMHRYNIQ